jgi:hypothetical protein
MEMGFIIAFCSFFLIKKNQKIKTGLTQKFGLSPLLLRLCSALSEFFSDPCHSKAALAMPAALILPID